MFHLKRILMLSLLMLSLTSQADTGFRLEHFDYPYPVTQFSLTSQQQELEMAYMDLAPSGKANGKTVVLFHGKNFCAATWRDTMAALSEAGYRVIAVDQIGFCKSSLIFAMGGKGLAKQVETRAGQCVLTSPTSALFSGLPMDQEEKEIPLGKNLRFFGDGYQISKMIDGKRYWRIPVMDGEFLAEETTGIRASVGGGNFLILAESQPQALAACEAAIREMRKLPNVIMPFPGGVVRSGSKVGSKYKALNASTNDAFCPTLKGQTKTELSPEVESVMEIVIDGLTEGDINKAMRAGIQAACELGAENGIRRISAGNYGGKLGPFHFHLQEIMA